jgi:hypothetical protein
MAIRSRRGVAAGAILALVVPLGSLLLAQLVETRMVPYDEVRALLDAIGTLSWLSLMVLGPLGIAVVGRSAGVRGIGGWAALYIIAAPAYVVLWFWSAVAISGALGNPF